MCKRLIYVMAFALMLGSTAQAGVYLWNGSAGDGNWDTVLNWTVTDSVWTWPNEEYGNRQVNSDTIAIDILNGDSVSRGSELGIDGAADGSTIGVLTLNNGSSLTVGDDLATSTDPGKRGQIDILGGSFVTILGDGNDVRIADDPNTWGMLNIVDSTLNIADDLRIDEGEGYVNISGSSTINADDIIAGDNATGVGYLDISGTATINVDDLKTDNGEGHITIGGSATLNLDDLMIDQPEGVGTIDIGGAATITIADDVELDDATGTINIGGTATVSNGDDFKVGDDPPGIGTCSIGDDATVTVGDVLYVGHNADAEGHMTISGNATVNILDDLIVANSVGTKGYLHISGNPTINITEQFYMNDDGPDEGMPMVPSTSQVIMDGGTVIVGSYTTFNDDNNGTAEFIMNGGSFYSTDYLNLSDNLDGTAHLTMNGGEMITGNRLRLGKDGGEDTGQVRIFMNGGLLQAEELSEIKITDTKIIYTGGEFRIGSASLDEAGMQQLITDGTIVPEVAYSIVTDGAYTALVTLEPVNPGTDGLIAYYAFENNANDSSDNGLHGTIVGDPVFVEGPAGYGMALDFDGVDDVVELGQFDVAGQITLAAWIMADDFEINDARIISKANEWGGNDHWWMLSTISETSLRFRLKTDDGQDTATLISDPVLEAGAWTHVAASWDGSTMRIYKDGVEVAGQEKGGTAVAVDPAVSVAIGSQPSDAFASDPSHVAKFFDGLIDEVAIYNRALSEGEILYLAGERATPVDPGSDGLVAYYALENDVLDSSGNGLDGTIVGEPAFVEGAVGMGLQFDGVDDAVDFGNDPLFDITGEVTLALWINTQDMGTGENNPWLGKGDTTYMIKGFRTGNQIEFFIYDGGWQSSFADVGDSFNGEWHHAAGTFDGAQFIIYVDGETKTVLGYEGPGIVPNTYNVALGTNTQAGGRFSESIMDEAMIYDRALSAGEIRYLAGYRFYSYDGDALDETWDHDNGSDAWDGTGPGEGMPGGAISLTEDDVTFLRIQDTGDPRDYGMPDPSNRKVYLTRPVDISLNGVRLEFRARVATTPPLDDMHPDGGAGVEPWPAEGLGYHIRDNGKGMFGVSDGVGIISFSLAQAGEPDFVDVATDVLAMNNLVGAEASGDVDTGDAATAVNMVAVDDVTLWNTFTIDIVAGGAGTHIVSVSVNGGAAEVFEVTTGTGTEGDLPYITIGSSGTGGITAFDVDYVTVSQ